MDRLGDIQLHRGPNELQNTPNSTIRAITKTADRVPQWLIWLSAWIIKLFPASKMPSPGFYTQGYRILYHETGKSVPPNLTNFSKFRDFACQSRQDFSRDRARRIVHLTFPRISCRICRVFASGGAGEPRVRTRQAPDR